VFTKKEGDYSVIYMCSKVKAELSKDNKILRIEKLK
jgi:hypothetical protein